MQPVMRVECHPASCLWAEHRLLYSCGAPHLRDCLLAAVATRSQRAWRPCGESSLLFDGRASTFHPAAVFRHSIARLARWWACWLCAFLNTGVVMSMGPCENSAPVTSSC